MPSANICYSHSADADNITLMERFDSFQTNADLYNRFERLIHYHDTLKIFGCMHYSIQKDF